MNTLLFVLLLLCFGGVLSQSDEVLYYANLIEEEFGRIAECNLPTDASEYRPHTNKTQVYGTFDYIIVGAGSAGAVVASRLSEDKHKKVLLIEAGGPESDFTDIPGVAFFLECLEYNWNYNSTTQKTCCQGMVNKQCPYPRGKALGGSSVINGLVYSRGNRKDYDRWCQSGNPGWCFDDVLPFFKKSEDFKIPAGDPGYHGTGGYLSVDYAEPGSPQLNAFLEANAELGYDILDYNGKGQIGAAKIQSNIINGRRDSTGKAFLGPARNRPNLVILTHSLATKILIGERNRTAYGVVFSRNRQLYVAYAREEVVLSTGSIGSPQLLMLSGIGPEDHLREHGIRPIHNLPVGEDLKEHPMYASLHIVTNYTVPVESTLEIIRQYLNGVGPYTVTGNLQGLGFYQSSFAKIPGLPDLELIIIPSNNSDPFLQKALHLTDETYNAVYGKLDPTRSFTFFVILLHPKSIGNLKLKSADPYDYPLIDPNMYSDPEGEDIERMYEGIQMALKLINTEALKRINATLLDPTLPACRKFLSNPRKYWKCQIRYVASHAFHPMSTCKMGPDPKRGAVVNHELKVHGIRNLRVADASVIPATVSGHTNAPSIMIGEKVAHMIKTGH